MKIKVVPNRKKKTNALTVKTGKGEKLEYAQAELLFQESFEVFLSFSYQEEKDGFLFCYDVTDLMSLKTFLDAKLSLSQFDALLADVADAVETCGNNGLTYTNMLFEDDHLYLDAESNKLHFAYVPASGIDHMRATITDLLRLIASRAVFICEEDAVQAHDLIDFLNRQTVFSLIDFKTFLQGATLKRQGKSESALFETAVKSTIRTSSRSASGATKNSEKGTFDFLKTQASSVSARETRQNQSLAEKIAFDVADAPSAPTNTPINSPTDSASSESSYAASGSGLSDDFLDSSVLKVDKPALEEESLPGSTTSSPFLEPSVVTSENACSPGTSYLGSGSLSGNLKDTSPEAPQKHSFQPFYFVRISTGDRTLIPSGREVSIGRSKKCDIPVRENTNISRVHAHLFIEGEECSLIDQGSTNGCFIHEEAAVPLTPIRLERGTTFKLADELFRLD